MDSYAPFRHADYRLLLFGTMLSTFGLQMLSVAVGWDLYLRTRSALVLGNVGFVQVAPFIAFALFAGHFADRFDRRRIMIVTQIPLLLASAILCFSVNSVVIIYVCLFLNAAGRAFQGPARQAMLAHSVPPELLGRAVTWQSSAQETASVSGPALAGFLIVLAGTRAVYVTQLICAILTLLCYALIRFRATPTESQTAPTLSSLLDGLRFVRDNKLVLSAISLDLFAVLFGGATALLPIYAVEVLHIGAHGLGLLRAAPSVGAVGMAILTAHRPQIHHAGRALLLAAAGFGMATIVFGFSHWVWLSFAMLLLTGAFDNVSVVLRQSLVQTKTPDHLRGRVNAVNNIFISCSNQLGAVESGWTAAWFGAIASVVAGGFATVAIVSAFAARSKSLVNWTQE